MKQQLFNASLSTAIRWLISPTDQLTAGPPIKGLQILNPLLAVKYQSSSLTALTPGGAPPVQLQTGELVFETRTLAIAADSSLHLFDAATAEQITATIVSLQRWLRVNTGQTRIPKNPTSAYASQSGVSFDHVSELERPTIDQTTGQGYAKEHLLVGATMHDLQHAAVAVSHGGSPPLSSSLFVDALTAYDTTDYEQCLLLCAIACDVAAGAYLSEAYNDALSMKSTDHRILTDNNGVDRDPVYAHLRKSTSFRLQLHERPLYLAGRSLLIDDEPLFNLLLQIYGARNRLVHTGETGPDDLDPSRANSEKAIGATKRFFDWLGLTSAPTHLITSQSMVSDLCIVNFSE